MSRAIQGAALLVAGVATVAVGLFVPGLGLALAWHLIEIGAAVAASGSAALVADALASNRGMNITTREAAGFRQIIWGMQRVGGTTIYQSTTGAGGSGGHYVYNFVVVLATHEIDSVVNVYLDGRQVFWRADGSIGNVGAGSVSNPPATVVTIAAGAVTSITATGGSGFASVAPARYRVRIYDGDGTGATAYATGGPGAWVVHITHGGSGYTVAPTAEIQGAYTFGGHARSDDPDPASLGYHRGYGIGPGGAHYNFDGKVYAEVRFGDQLAGDVINELAINDPVWVNGGAGGKGAQGVGVVGNASHQVMSVTITNGGGGYLAPPTVTFSSSIGSGAAGTALVYGGRVVGVAITNGGSGYNPLAPVTVTFSPPASGYKTPYVGGCAYLYINVGYDPAMFPTYPEIRVTVRGRNDIYDPRTGKTTYTNNWALCVSRALTDPVFGIGDDVNQAQLIAAANVCDEWVPTSQGVERRYGLDVHYDTSTSPGDAIALMMPAAAGRLSYIAGEWWIFPAYWQGPSFTFDESALVDAPTWNPYRSFRELVNRVTGTYIAPNFPYHVAGNLYDRNGWYYGQTDNTWAFAWQPTNFPMYAADQLHGYASDVFLDEDGGIPLPRELALRGVISIGQAQRVAKIELLRNRQQGSGTFPMMLSAWEMQELDVMQFSFPVFSWANKFLEITRNDFAIDPTKAEGGDDGALAITCIVLAQETAPSVYDWDISEELTPYDVAAAPGSVDPTPAPPTGLAIADSTTTALMLPNGQTMPRLLITWTPPDDTYVNNGGRIQVQWRDHAFLHAAGAWIDTGDHDGNSTYCYVDGVSSVGNIDVQARSIRGNGAASDWVLLNNSPWSHPPRSGPIVGTSLDDIGDGTVRYAAAESGANVTSGHILTATSTMSADHNFDTTLDTAPGLGFTLTTAGAADVYNIWGAINVDPGGTSFILTFNMYLDGVLHDSQTIGVVSGSGGWETVPYFNSFTGLTAGTHTITFKASVNTGNLTFHQSTRFICQRIW